MVYLLKNYSAHLTLDVSTNNVSGCAFYKRIGLTIEKLYLCGKDQVEFATFTTPIGFNLQILESDSSSATSSAVSKFESNMEETKEI